MRKFNKNGMVIGQRLRQLRKLHEYSQEYMALQLDISQKTYSNMENDKASISLDTLSKIADLYGMDLMQLISSDAIVVHGNTSKDNSTFQGGVIHNHNSEDVFQLMQQQLQDLRERVQELKELLKEKDMRIAQLESIGKTQ